MTPSRLAILDRLEQEGVLRGLAFTDFPFRDHLPGEAREMNSLEIDRPGERPCIYRDEMGEPPPSKRGTLVAPPLFSDRDAGKINNIPAHSKQDRYRAKIEIKR